MLRQGQPLVDRVPGVPPVFAAPNSVASGGGVGARVIPTVAPALPRGGVDAIRVLGVQRQINGACARVDEQHELPGLTPIARAVHATLRVVRPFVPASGDVDGVGIGRVHAHARDGVRVLQAHVGEGRPTVLGQVHARARHRAAEDVGLARPHPKALGVRRVHGQGSDGAGGPVLKERFEGRSLVAAAPQPAGGRGHVEGVVLPTRSGNGHVHHAATDVGRPDEAPGAFCVRRIRTHGLMNRVGRQTTSGINRSILSSESRGREATCQGQRTSEDRKHGIGPSGRGERERRHSRMSIQAGGQNGASPIMDGDQPGAGVV